MVERPSKLISYRFDQMADQISDRVMPGEANVERYVGLEHLDPDSLRIRRWGDTSDVESTKLLFQPGDIIFGKRRVYQRKVAVADFEGICSAHAMVLRAKRETVLPEFLPFFMQSDLFMERALTISVGSLSPTINWKALAKEEFLLPPIEEQASLVEILRSIDEANETLRIASSEGAKVNRAIIEEVWQGPSERTRLEKFALVITKGESPRWQGFEYLSEGIPFITSENVLEGEIDDRTFKCIPQDFHKKLSRSKIYANDVLINIVGASIGRAAVVPKTIKEANTNQAVALVRLNQEKLLPEFLVGIYLSQTFQRHLSQMMVNSARANISLTDIRNFEIPTPCIGEQKLVVERIKAVQAQIIAISRRRSRLAVMREKIFSSWEKDDF